MNWGLIIVIAIVVVVVLFVIGLYNGLVQRRLRIDEAFAQIEVQLKRRHDLIPNLVNAVKGYMGFEQKVLTDVTNARAAAVAAGAQGPAAQAQAENMLTGTLRSLFAVVENYPELKANQNVLELQEQLTTTENQIAFSRQHYNASVLDYNTAIQVFPAVLIAGMFGFTKREFFDAEPEANTVPVVDLTLSWAAAGPARAGSTTGGRSDMADTFYNQISANRRNSLVLALAVILLFGVLGFTIGYAISGSSGGAIAISGIALLIGGLAAVGSYFAGDSIVLSVSGAKEVDETSAPQLLNVVREMAIAANLPMPKVYVIDDTAPNAFATGRDPKHASVAITTGLLEKLDREELQGVMGHELSHVRNFDIRFAMIVGVLVGSIALLADFFLRFTFWGGGRRSSRDDRGGGGGLQAIMFVVAIVLSILAPIAARLVQLAVNRQREFLADASSVQLTRNPYGIERALAKISADTEVLEVANRATQHMYFTNPIKKFEERASGLFSTHPAALDRINRLRELTGDPPLQGAEAAQLAGLD